MLAKLDYRLFFLSKIMKTGVRSLLVVALSANFMFGQINGIE